MDLILILALTIITSLLTSSVMLIAHKYRVFDYYRAKRKLWMPELCFFCVCFWISLVNTILIHQYNEAFNYFDLFIAALCSAPIAWKLTQM